MVGAPSGGPAIGHGLKHRESGEAPCTPGRG
jgi:hypothetical protein